MYPRYNQEDPDNPNCAEDCAYPAAPDSEYGWEKLFSERLYLAYDRNSRHANRVARYHNIFGPEGTWAGRQGEGAGGDLPQGGARRRDGGAIEIWGDGRRPARSSTSTNASKAPLRLTRSDFEGPVNIGSDEMVTINQLADMVADIAGKKLDMRPHPGPARRARPQLRQPADQGESSAGRPSEPLRDGLEKTYAWIEQRLGSNVKGAVVARAAATVAA